jgi:hypothetical protein
MAVNGNDTAALVRQQSWTCDGPAELELVIDVGRLRVRLEDRPDHTDDRDAAPAGESAGAPRGEEIGDEIRAAAVSETGPGGAEPGSATADAGPAGDGGGSDAGPPAGDGAGTAAGGGDAAAAGGDAAGAPGSPRAAADAGPAGHAGGPGAGTGASGPQGEPAGGTTGGEHETTGREVRVEVRHDPSAGSGWTRGLSSILTWLGDAAGAPGPTDPDELAAAAVRAAEISWSESERRLVVRSSDEIPLRTVPLAVTVTAPDGSRLVARTGAGDVAVTGRAGKARVRTGSGAASLSAVAGEADVVTGSGDIDLGEVRGRARVRTGSGQITLDAAGGPTEVKAGTGDVAVGAVSADLGVRTGSGEVSVADARAGRLELTTGSGELRVAVHPGVAAELDLSSGSGRARSELDVSRTPPEQEPALHVRGRTGSGDVLVTRAVAG